MYGQMVTITIMSPKFTTGKSSNASICFTFLHGGGRGEVGKGWVEGVGGLGGGGGAPLSHLRHKHDSAILHYCIQTVKYFRKIQF